MVGGVRPDVSMSLAPPPHSDSYQKSCQLQLCNYPTTSSVHANTKRFSIRLSLASSRLVTPIAARPSCGEMQGDESPSYWPALAVLGARCARQSLSAMIKLNVECSFLSNLRRGGGYGQLREAARR